jgi:hypothetical protein
MYYGLCKKDKYPDLRYEQCKFQKISQLVSICHFRVDRITAHFILRFFKTVEYVIVNI